MNSCAPPLFALILLLGVVLPATASETQLTLVVSDQDLDPIPGASAILRPWKAPSAAPITPAKTDSAGETTHTIPLPDGNPIGFDLEISRDGYFPETTKLIATPGAKLTTEVTLTKKIATRLRFLEVDRSPAAHRRFVMRSWNKLTTDENGEFLFTHPPFKKSFTLTFRGQSFTIRPTDGGTTKEIQPIAVPQLTSFLSSNPHPQLYPSPTDPVATVRGILVSPSGEPARGWLIAKQVRKTGGWMIISSVIIPGSAHFEYRYNSIEPVADDGSFELSPAFEDLIIVSPEGVPFRYPLNPSAWTSESGLKETTITTPKIDTTSMKLRLSSAEGEPAIGYRAEPDYGSSYDIWDLRPTIDDRQERVYADQPSPPALFDRLSNPAVSDGDGEITIPIHPWRNRRRIGLIPPAENLDGHWTWPNINQLEGGKVAFFKEYPQAAAARIAKFQLRDLTITSLKDSDGKKIDPERLRWTLTVKDNWSTSGKGGFVPTRPGSTSYRLAVIGGEGQLRFDYQNPRGVLNHLTIPFDLDNPLPAERAIQLEVDKEAPLALSGKILDANGEPLENIRLHLIDPTATDSNRKYLQIFALTNRAGEFKFPTAPSECSMTVAAVPNERQIFPLDDLVEIPAVTGSNRKLEMKLKPTGSVTIKLLDPKGLPDRLFLFSKGEELGPDSRMRIFLYQSDTDPFVYDSPFVAPGDYQLASIQGRFRSLSDSTITVTADQNTKIEITPPAELAPPIPPPLVPVQITVTRNGKPAPGIIVKSEPIQEKASQNPFGRHVTNYVGDTTDNDGKAHFRAANGAKIFYAVMDHQQRTAWKTVEISDDAIELTIDFEAPSKEEDSARARELFGL
ncbi:MAG: hypothetical protein ACR2RV_25115 [Verrucomicrobiales bacterium]